jgi:hypothetical protein
VDLIVIFSDHAKQRAAQRSPNLEENLLNAFEKSVSVGLPEYSGAGYLHCPTGTIFLTKKTRTDRVVVTVIPAKDIELNVDHLVKCADCGLRYDGGEECCVWCGSEERVLEVSNQYCRLCDEEIKSGEASELSDDVHQSCQDEVREMF